MNWNDVHKSREGAKYPCEDVVRFMARNYYRHRDSLVKVLEIGCGTGANLWYCSREGFEVCGFEGSSVAYDKAKELLGTLDKPRFGLLQGDILQLLRFHHSELFDCILDIEAMYANPYDIARMVYAECYRVLKPGGRMLIKHFAHGTSEHLLDDTFMRLITKEEVPDLIGQLNIVSCDLHTRTHGGGIIKEWVIEAVK